MTTIGERLEAFYVQLVSVQSKIGSGYSGDEIHLLLRTVQDLTINDQQEKSNDTLSPDNTEHLKVQHEIIKDAQKKASQVIRPYYIDLVNQLITSSTKRLRAKTASDNSTDHSQRHIYVLLELLGTWSNIIAEILAVNFEKEQVLFLLGSLSQRVHSLAYDCYLTFKSDKDLEGWCSKCADINSNINILALDQLIQQLLQIKHIVTTYYAFLAHTCAAYTTPTAPIDPSSPMLLHYLHQHKALQADSLFLVSTEETRQWREMNSFYVLLEAAYLAHSVLEACSDSSYAQIETHVFLPQYQEDVFYLLDKVKTRLLDHAFDEQSVFALAQKLLEVITVAHDSSLVSAHDKHSLVYCMVGFRSLFKGGMHAYLDPNTQSLLLDNANHFVFHALVCDCLGKQREREEVKGETNGETTAGALVRVDNAASEAGNDSSLLFTPQKTREAAGEGGQTQWTTWLTNLASPYIPTSDSSPTSSTPLPATPLHSAQKLTPPTSASSSSARSMGAAAAVSLESLLFHALELDGPGEQAGGGAGNMVGQAGHWGVRDWRVEWERAERQIDKFYQDVDIWGDLKSGWAERLWKGLPASTKSDPSLVAQSSSQDLLSLFLGPTPYLEEKVRESGGRLLDRDEGVLYLNALGGVVKGVRGLAQFFILDGEGKEVGQYPSLAILSKEFSSCVSSYEHLLNRALRGVLSVHFYRYLQQPARDFCQRSYSITGAEMESRYHSLPLVHLTSLYLLQVRLRGGGSAGDEDYYRGFVREYRESVGGGGGWVNSIFQSVTTVSSWIGGPATNSQPPTSHHTPPTSSSGTSHDPAKPPSPLYLSEEVWWEFLLCVAELMYEGVVLGGCIMERQFNEWGALLLQQEVLQLVRYLNSLFAHAPDPYPSRHALLAQRVTIICSLLAIDKPSYVESIALPAVVREEEVKAVLRRRGEFTEDSVKAVKLKWKHEDNDKVV